MAIKQKDDVYVLKKTVKKNRINMQKNRRNKIPIANDELPFKAKVGAKFMWVRHGQTAIQPS